jgi:hypothetical protein
MSPLIATMLVVITGGLQTGPQAIVMERFPNAASCEAVAERITHRYQLAGGRGNILAFCIAAN